MEEEGLGVHGYWGELHDVMHRFDSYNTDQYQRRSQLHSYNL